MCRASSPQQKRLTRFSRYSWRPDFGCGLNALVFGPNGPEIAAAVQHTVQGSLQRWLAERIRLDEVVVASDDGRLEITVRYTRLLDRVQRTETFTREGGR